ncbi:4-hydroxy-tetrahydrodipicolinate reductase [Helicobacter jaachi]|uniref:4-hydroxy-tetrahydrodipicolinate reductase n=1 Tax=Helicobacter jaachi TaxID=1677920 RepID=A0A4U8T8M7_9HELI|nr:4-hydroxy-tetrahydrodipicolinate reductase [Helicobacter jaachi]TLD96070.1 4-hydroxy-tetrahydrodipicolinate reductase [Helicobacter jaachi]
MLQIGIFGATGRVGKLLIDEILNHEQFELSSVYVRNELQYSLPASTMITRDFEVFLQSSDVIIDFSSPEATKALLEVAPTHPTPLVIGTTGLDNDTYNLLESAANSMPILYAANMSKGIAMLDKIAALVAATLKESDIEICEIHHRYKKDAPSGTALSLAQSCAKARNLNLDSVRVSGRDGHIGQRRADEIGVMSLRGGDVVGRHTIGFYLDGEYLELTHNATSRLTFAKGALDMASFIVRQENGLYSIQDALNL